MSFNLQTHSLITLCLHSSGYNSTTIALFFRYYALAKRIRKNTFSFAFLAILGFVIAIFYTSIGAPICLASTAMAVYHYVRLNRILSDPVYVEMLTQLHSTTTFRRD
jgi:hypothetical protein